MEEKTDSCQKQRLNNLSPGRIDQNENLTSIKGKRSKEATFSS